MLGVDLVDDDQAAQPAPTGALEHAPRHLVDAGLGVDDHRRGFDRLEGAECVADEVGVAGGVDQVGMDAVDVAVGDRGGQRVAVGLLLGFVVADHGAAPEVALRADRAGGVEQGLDQ